MVGIREWMERVGHPVVDDSMAHMRMEVSSN
jgi:hypothetical protein